jgi:hypothetical protein
MNNPQKARKVQGIIHAVMLFLRTDIGNERVCVLVEGPKDSGFYHKFFRDVKTRVMVIKSGGKPLMLKALGILTNCTKQAIGICDADFYHLDQNYPALTNLFITDCHDIEMTMQKFNSVIETIVVNYSPRNSAENILRTALHETSYMAYVRWYNEKNACHLNFKKLDLNTAFIISDEKIKIDIIKFLSELNNVSNNKTIIVTTSDIARFIETYKTADYFNLCNGHDVIFVMALIIDNGITQEEYREKLQNSFTVEYFVQTNLYKSLLAWQTANGFNILLHAENDVNNG